MSMPVYIVIGQQIPNIHNFQCDQILKVIECDVEEIQDIYTNVITQMYHTYPNIHVTTYAREPANPFKTWEEYNRGMVGGDKKEG